MAAALWGAAGRPHLLLETVDPGEYLHEDAVG